MSQGKDVLKEDFSKVFKTITMTAGSLSGCIRRATSLDDRQAITKCVDNVVHALSQARIIAYWAIENYLYQEVTEAKSTVSADVDPLEPSDPPESTGPPANGDPLTSAVPPASGPLDLPLDSSHGHGTTIIRNLLSSALGDSGGHDTEDPERERRDVH